MNTNEIITFFSSINQKYGKLERLFKLFSTKEKKYMYDAGTGKVLECSDFEFAVLNCLLQKENIQIVIEEVAEKYKNLFDTEIMGLVETIRKQHLLSAGVLDKFDREKNAITNKAVYELQQITLELTECCNLACYYCIYGSENVDFREFGNGVMSWEIAKRAIDYALEHALHKLAITFYGGEPLLNFELLQRSVEYSLANRESKEITFSMTTNLTLVTEDIAYYLSKVPNFSVVGSIDGIEKVHNKNRIYKNGEGSYSSAILGLENLVNAYGNNAKDRIMLSMVIDTSVEGNIMERNQSFFNELRWLPKEIIKRISYIRPSSDKEIEMTEKSQNIYSEPIGDWSVKKQLIGIQNTLFTNDFMERMLLSIHNRILTETPIQKYHLNGCCYPGSRRLYVDVGGEFYVCERIGKSPTIGNVYSGLDEEKLLNEYHKSYIENSISECADCWALNLCEVCFMECYDEMGFNFKKKRMACNRNKCTIERNLSTYFSILENNPEIIEKLDEVIIS